LAQLLRLPFHESVAAWERRLVENALIESGGNKAVCFEIWAEFLTERGSRFRSYDAQGAIACNALANSAREFITEVRIWPSEPSEQLITPSVDRLPPRGGHSMQPLGRFA
jgi:hypothetical protein